jgi:GT2 family glycosyltransferase
VVAVVVTHEPGEWFASTLEALAEQDYPDLRVIVVDCGSALDPSERVRQILPDAAVYRLGKNVGFGAAANEVINGGIAGSDAADAEFFLFCHDDVAPEATALRVLVETALDWDASVVGPKLVRWDDPRWVLQMGEAVDKTATAVPLIESDELDQGQHDGLREVFAVPGGITLVRARTFARIGGFDEVIKLTGDNLSLCWRTRISGGRVLVTSATRVRHRQALGDRVPDALRRRLEARAQLRVLLTCYGRWHTVRVLPQVVAMSLIGAVSALVTTRLSDARAFLGAWSWNLLRLPSLWMARRHVRRFRRVGDRQLRRLQVPGVTRSRRIVRRRASTAGSFVVAGNGADGGHPPLTDGNGSSTSTEGARPDLQRAAGDHRGWTSESVVVALVLAGVLLMGSRHLLTRGVPFIGDLVPFDTPSNLFDEWRSGWRRTGLGSDSPAPSIFVALSALGTLVGEQMALLRTALTVGLIPLGVVGAFRLLRPTGSSRASIGAAVAYAVVPVPYAALSAGRWAPLAAYAAAPWLLARLARGSGAPPYGAAASTPVEVGKPTMSPSDPTPATAGDAALGGSGVARHALVLGITTALLGMLVPAALVMVSLLAGALALGSLLAFEARYTARLVAVAVGGMLVAALLHLPWSLAAIGWAQTGASPPTWFSAPWSGGEAPALDLFGLSTVKPTASPYAWALVAAAALALLVGRSWRLGWAIRGWIITLAAWGVVWAHQHDIVQAPLPDVDVLMTLAGTGLALAIGCGVAAVEHDVVGRSRRLGLRRLATALAALSMGVAVVPLARASVHGYWGMPRGDFSSMLGAVDEGLEEVPSRVLWLGDPAVLPVHGWDLPPDMRDGADASPDDIGTDGLRRNGEPLNAGVAYATTWQGQPMVQDLWPGPRGGSHAGDGLRQLEEAVNLARARQTTRLGRLLAPMAVQYIAVPQRLAPSSFAGTWHPAPQDLLDGLAEQLDLERVQVDPSLVIYRNLAFLPARASVAVADSGEVSPPELSERATVEEVALANPDQAQPALEGGEGFADDRGELDGEVTLLQSVAASDTWSLQVDGVAVERSTAFGWANQFAVASAGSAELRYETPAARDVVLGVQLVLWLLAVLIAVSTRRRALARQRARRVEDVVPRAVPQWIEMPEDELVRVITSGGSGEAADGSQRDGGSALDDVDEQPEEPGGPRTDSPIRTVP